jgi:hypothetical protein
MKSILSSSGLNQKTILCLIIVLQVCLTKVSAQYSERTRPTVYIGIESSIGNRSFSISSNIPELDNLKVTEEGLNIGLIAGSEAVRGRFRYGMFKSSALVRQEVNLSEAEIGINIFPLYIFNQKSKFIKPYSIISFDYGTMKFYGNFALPKVEPPPPPSHMACPDAPQPPPVDESHEENNTPDEITDENRILGKLTVSRFNLGGGVQIHIPIQNKYINLFAEAKYCLPMGIKATVLEFEQTKVSRQLAVNVGISFGFRN